MRPGSRRGTRGPAPAARPALCWLPLGLALLILAAPWPARAAEPDERPVILAAVPISLPPYFIANERGEPDGFAVELLRRVAAKAGYDVRLLPAPGIREAELMVREGRAHLLPGLGHSAARAVTLVFSRPFDVQTASIYVREGAAPLETLDRLAGRRVALAAGSIPAEMLAERKDILAHPVRTLPEGVFAVLTGEADALIFLDAAVEQAARAAGVEHRLRRSQRPALEVRRAFAAHPEHAAMLADLDSALERFRDTDEFRQIYQRWHPPKSQRITPEAFWSLAALAVAAIVWLLAWRYVSLVRLNRRMAVALSERDQALASLRHTEERLEALFTLSHMEATSSEELVQFALEQGVRLTGSQVGYLFFVSGDSVDLASVHWSKSVRESCALLGRMEHDSSVVLDGAGLWNEPMHALEPVIVNDFATDPRRKGLPEGHSALDRFMGVPLVADGRALAVFGVGNKPGPYDDTDARQLQLFLSGLWRVLQARRDAEAIGQARDYAESLLAGANALVVGLDREGRVTAFNAAAEAVTGLTRAGAMGRNWFDLLAPREKGGLTPELLRAAMDGQADLPGDAEGLLTTRQGQTRRITWRNSLLRTGGRQDGVICFGIDITERREAEESMRALHRAMEQAAEGVLITDREGAVTFVNPALERMTGFSAEDIRRLGAGLLEPDQGGAMHQPPLSLWEQGEGVWRGSNILIGPEGQAAEVESTVTAVHGPDGEVVGFVTLCRDVTEKRLLERQLWQAQKMDALGTLAGGIAHDFNNILTSIVGFTELAMDDIPPGGRARTSLERVLQASRRARELVRQILTFGRRTDRARTALDADQSIGEALRLMEASLPKEVEIEARLGAAGCSILADPSQVHQIVLNLCTNAAQAMAGGGRIAVATRRVRREADPTQRLPAGDCVELTVEDTGPGIQPEHLGRIFDPFFTTKGAGQGTGLGLAVVHGIAGSLGGTVQAGSAPGGGARLTVLLPVSRTASTSPPDAPIPPDHGRERILLVDDDADLLDLSRQALEPLGYRVEAFHGPQEALQAFLAEPGTFGLLLTDQSMPGLSGDQLAERMRQARPDLPVLFCTGGDMAVPQERLLALGGATALAKPFTPAELARAVRRALDASGKAPGD